MYPEEQVILCLSRFYFVCRHFCWAQQVIKEPEAFIRINAESTQYLILWRYFVSGLYKKTRLFRVINTISPKKDTMVTYLVSDLYEKMRSLSLILARGINGSTKVISVFGNR